MIHIEHLHKKIGKQTILNDINITIGRGEIVGLLGPNGAGKSTLMKCLTGLWQFEQGSIEICGIKSELQMPHKITELIGYLPENNPLYNEMYVREYLLFIADIQGLKRKERRATIEAIIERVGLQKMANKQISELSKGYKQRVGLAQALIGEPQLLILDEPTTGLDPNQLDEVRVLIKELGKDRTIILSTHILQEVEAMCTRAVILAEGEIREDTTDLRDLEQLFRERTR